ncbi:TPA: divalent-cation tolerance protein CutA, partial [Candidatus Woesearchaeota archaeon]|nr:divalent-cation tolerance protein CutA [Candidatus Woesearchaeota archaeon]
SRKEAEKISMSLLRKKLAGCCNVFPVASAYLWKGKIEKAKEHSIIIKTSGKNFSAVEREIKRLNSYKIPCIEGWDVAHA